jgi:hypothetical protein
MIKRHQGAILAGRVCRAERRGEPDVRANIGKRIVDTATSPLRLIRFVPDAGTPRLGSRPAAAPKAAGPPAVIEISLIRIVVNLGR